MFRCLPGRTQPGTQSRRVSRRRVMRVFSSMGGQLWIDVSAQQQQPCRQNSEADSSNDRTHSDFTVATPP